MTGTSGASAGRVDQVMVTEGVPELVVIHTLLALASTKLPAETGTVTWSERLGERDQAGCWPCPTT